MVMKKLYVAGPLDPTFHAQAALRKILSQLESRNDIDVYLRPTSINLRKFPLTQYMADLLTKPPVAPFDAALVVHDITNMHTSLELRESSRLLLAYVVQNHKQIPERLTLKARLRPFDVIVPDNSLTQKKISDYTGKPLIPRSVSSLIEFITPVQR